MRPEPCPLSLPEWDDEGYPINRDLTTPQPALCQPQVDGESGECLQDKVIVLRRSKTYDPKGLNHPDFDILPMILLQEQLYLQDLRLYCEEFNKGPITCSLDFDSDILSELYYHHQRNTVQDSREVRTRRKFQVPPQYLHNKPNVEAYPNCTISIWQEFIYGPPIMMMGKKNLTKDELDELTDVGSSLSKFVDRNIVDVFLYMFFFGVYFVYCCMFNNILELALYIFYGSHLCIHQMANASNVEVTFSKSIFQAPAYVLIKMGCKHCIQKENAKVMRHLMHKMKRDIMEAKVK